MRVTMLMLGATLMGAAAAPAYAQTTATPSNTMTPNTMTNGAVTPADTDKVTKGGFLRASKIDGADVYGANNTDIGTIDDILLSQHSRAVDAVLSVGGFLGVGSKLVKVPFDHLRLDKNGHLVLSNATKQSLERLPAYTYDAS